MIIHFCFFLSTKQINTNIAAGKQKRSWTSWFSWGGNKQTQTQQTQTQIQTQQTFQSSVSPIPIPNSKQSSLTKITTDGVQDVHIDTAVRIYLEIFFEKLNKHE